MLLSTLKHFITVVLTATTAIVLDVNAAPALTEGLARRATVSGSVTCSYICPDNNGYGVNLGAQQTGPDGTSYVECRYYYGEYEPTCAYVVSTGKLYEGVLNLGECPAMAGGPVCGQSPDGVTYFKRSERHSPRELTLAELAIKERQYVPKRPME